MIFAFNIMEHLRYFDPIFGFIITVVKYTFWWIPMNWWIQKVYQLQEEACDYSCSQYGVDRFDLSNGIVKTLSFSYMNKNIFTSPLVSSHTRKRIMNLLNTQYIPEKGFSLIIKGILVFAMTIVVILGKIWVF